MERFDLSYRVADPPKTRSLTLKVDRPTRPRHPPPKIFRQSMELDPHPGDIQQTQICRIVDASNGQSASAEGLFYQLIVRLHKYSLGRVHYTDSVHWQRGLVLEDKYKGRALLEHIGNDVRITVRSPYPEGLLGMLTREVKYLVESFWEGLRCDVMVPCIEPCGRIHLARVCLKSKNLMEKQTKGTAMNNHVPSAMNGKILIRLLRNAPAATQANLTGMFCNQRICSPIKDKLDVMNSTDTTRAAFSPSG